MKLKCPNQCLQDPSSHKSNFRKDGVYFRKSDSKTIQRYRCCACGKSFSKATFSPCYRQKKRRVNEVLFKLLSSGVSMRRAAIILNIHRKTVKRKMDFLAERARERYDFFLDSLSSWSPSIRWPDHNRTHQAQTFEHFNCYRREKKVYFGGRGFGHSCFWSSRQIFSKKIWTAL